jgi:hypothetical protein
MSQTKHNPPKFLPKIPAKGGQNQNNDKVIAENKPQEKLSLTSLLSGLFSPVEPQKQQETIQKPSQPVEIKNFQPVPLEQLILMVPDIDNEGLPEAIKPMIQAITIYDKILSEENICLKNADSQGVAALLDKKISATVIYQERFKNLMSDQSALSSLTTLQRDSIISRVQILDKKAKENLLLLKANMGAIEQVFDVINKAALKVRRKDVAYSADGSLKDEYSPHNVSLAFNQSV